MVEVSNLQLKRTTGIVNIVRRLCAAHWRGEIYTLAAFAVLLLIKSFAYFHAGFKRSLLIILLFVSVVTVTLLPACKFLLLVN